jgi:pimeloyl-ACP methyl ester carboxylesterase
MLMSMQDVSREYAAPLSVAGRSLSLFQLGTSLGAEVVDIVERMHGTISDGPSPLDQNESARTSGVARFAYSAIRGSFDAASFLSGHAARAATELVQDPPEGDAWIRVRAAINGVYGNTLASVRNPMAQPMKIIGRRGEGRTRVLFIHGLCMSELGWERGGQPDFARWCESELGAQTGYVRYNTGNGIPANGRELAGLLESLVSDERLSRLILIGHSMGGLLIRSAREFAERAQHTWVRRLTDVATLGTPHLGAPAARIGAWANGVLRVSPYTRPLSRLGDLRSEGIQDLRYGRVRSGPEHRAAGPARGSTEPRKRVKNFFIAATRSTETPEKSWRAKDDGLVPVASALGLSRDEERTVEPRRLRRHVVPSTDHMQLLGSPEVYGELREWLS